MAVRKMLMTSLSFTTSFRLTRTTNPTIVPLPFPSHSRKVHSEAQQGHSATPRGELVGWWSGVCAEGKVPYGEIIHISANEGRYLAKSYSPWQLATGKTGTPLFEIYVTSGLQGEYKEQAVCLKHKAACQDSLGSRKDTKIQLDTGMFLLTDPNSKNGANQWAKTLMRLEASEGRLPDSDEFRNFTESDEFRNFWAKFGKNYEVGRGEATEAAVHTLEEKTAYFSHFAVGDIVEKSTTPHKDVLRVPAVLERKGCASFSLTLEEDTDSHVSGGYNPEDYYTTDHGVFDLVDCMARGIHRENVGRTKLAKRKHKDNLVIRAKNQLPLLSHLTIFNRIDVSVSSDPLNGLYIGSNGYLATEVIKIRRLFGPWQEIGSTKDVSELEVCEYLEAVNLTGDSVIPAGQATFRAKVGEEYKLSPITYLEEKYGAVARYKGEGRLAGFQDSKLVDVEILIFEDEYRRDGFPIGVLYSAPEYYYFKLFKLLKLQSFQGSN
ncbi:Protein EXECUTER 1, chloroplastic [Heracleum sosnowskyi]|uniref:Protein EXECUTER 1, chloroplastic n=1 Tax=Heracleum sosnowskyi TaxID=360622 RepID=A0AAD8II10_9APIA|nr:Protein EXECUTER 1, chloroplastic [Heracleum sosnowskyi]